MRDFRKLTIWQDAIALVKNIYSVADRLPEKEKYGLTSQICRAAVSIPSNIAEGCNRSSEVEVKRFLEIAIGSAFELETQVIILAETKMIEKESVNGLLTQIKTLQSRINAFIEKVKERI
jgi:four helix bundle protein